MAELGKGELLFATHSNTEHLALIERAVGPFPRALVQRSRYATKYFDSDARSTWEQALPRDGRDHVRRMPPLRQYCEPDRDLHKLLEGLLTIDPDRRLTAKDATCAFLERALTCRRFRFVVKTFTGFADLRWRRFRFVCPAEAHGATRLGVPTHPRYRA